MNGREVDPLETGISYAAWNVLMFIGVILLWNMYPNSEGNKKTIFSILKWTGLVLLITLLVIYRRDVDGEIHKTGRYLVESVGHIYQLCLFIL